MDISLGAHRVAPKSGSAFIHHRAGGPRLAKLGAGRETRDALGRVEALVSPLPVPDRGGPPALEDFAMSNRVPIHLTLADLHGALFAAVSEVAAILRADPRTIRKSIERGEIPVHPGRCRLPPATAA